MRPFSARFRNILPVAVVIIALITMAFTAGGGFPSNPFFPTGAVLNFGAGNMTITHATGTLTLAGGQLLIARSLSAALPGLGFGPDPTTGIYQTGGGTIGIAINGAEAVMFNSDGPQIAGTIIRLGGDTYLYKEATDVWQSGSDAAVPLAQTFKGPDARAGTDSNTVGGVLKQAGGRPTGTGLPGIVGLQGSLLSTTTGTAASALIDRFIANAAKVLTNNNAITVVNADIANGTSVGGLITYTIEVWNGTDNQVESGQAIYSAMNKAGTVTTTITEINSQQNLNSGTLATTWAASAANPVAISINANSSLTPNTGFPRITYSIQNFGQQAVAIQ